MVRMVRKSKQTICISEEGASRNKHVFEFQYHDASGAQTAWNPNMDIFETTNDLVVLVEAAGLDESSVQLHAVENRLILSGERQLNIGEDIMRYHQLEVQFMPFQKTLILPSKINIDHVKAQYKNGFLIIRVSKKNLEGFSNS